MFDVLDIYDFDGTLFRSPEPPAGWDRRRDWWSSSESLSFPCVPVVPDASWWIGSTVKSARASVADRKTLAILATGRSDRSFARYRVPELLGSVNLDFDRVHLAPASGQASAFKSAVVAHYLRRFSSIRLVRAWEDTKRNIDAMARVCATLGVNFSFELVKAAPKKVDCEDVEQIAARVARRYSSYEIG